MISLEISTEDILLKSLLRRIMAIEEKLGITDEEESDDILGAMRRSILGLKTKRPLSNTQVIPSPG